MARVVLDWDLGPRNPGPLMDVTIANPRDYIEAMAGVGLEYNQTVTVKALIDTGAAITVINRKFAQYCKLFVSNPRSEISSVGHKVECWEHAAAISFPGSSLRSKDLIKILSTEFVQPRDYVVLIGRDIIRNWRVTVDGPAKQITIEE